MIGFLSGHQVICCKSNEPKIRNHQACKKNTSFISRRGFLELVPPTLFSIWCFGTNPVSAEPSTSDTVCSFCNGKGRVVCDMCEGTGFWKAITPKSGQYYKGVSCPQCSGSGYLTCPVCLGTGLGDVKGMLRRNKGLGSGKGIFGTD